MTLLESSQVVFNLTLSMVAIIILVLISTLVYSITITLKSIRDRADAIQSEFSQLSTHLRNSLINISHFSFITDFLKRRKMKKEK